MRMRERVGIIENIRSGNFIMMVSLAASVGACYMAWAGNLPLAVGLTGVAGMLFEAGAAVSFANERLEAMANEYRERENSRELWQQISRLEDEVAELKEKE